MTDIHFNGCGDLFSCFFRIKGLEGTISSQYQFSYQISRLWEAKLVNLAFIFDHKVLTSLCVPLKGHFPT